MSLILKTSDVFKYKKIITCIFDILYEHGCDEGVTVLVLYTRGTGVNT